MCSGFRSAAARANTVYVLLDGCHGAGWPDVCAPAVVGCASSCDVCSLAFPVLRSGGSSRCCNEKECCLRLSTTGGTLTFSVDPRNLCRVGGLSLQSGCLNAQKQLLYVQCPARPSCEDTLALHRPARGPQSCLPDLGAVPEDGWERRRSWLRPQAAHAQAVHA